MRCSTLESRQAADFGIRQGRRYDSARAQLFALKQVRSLYATGANAWYPRAAITSRLGSRGTFAWAGTTEPLCSVEHQPMHRRHLMRHLAVSTTPLLSQRGS